MILDDIREMLAVIKRKLRLPDGSAAIEEALRRSCRGDTGAAARLIALEKSRAPKISHRDACIRALERLEQDRLR